MLLTLFAGGAAGLANNGDFIRVMRNTGIAWQGAPGGAFFFEPKYVMNASGGGFFADLKSILETVGDRDYSSVTFVFVYASKVLNLVANYLRGRDPSIFSIAWLGLLCAIFHSFGAALFVRAFRDFHPAALIASVFASVFIFCDQGYILYFNSFYGEQFQIFTLLIAVSSMLLVLAERKLRYGAVALVAAFFYSGSKYANLPVGLLLCCVCCALLFLRIPGSRKRAVSAGLSVLAIALIVLQFASVPSWMDEVTTYQSVFYGAVRNKATAEADLAELGVDPKYAPLANTNGYLSEYPISIRTDEFRRDFYERVTKSSVAFFYLRHPSRLLGKLNTALLSSDSIAPPYLGNTVKGASPRLTMIGRFNIWGRVRGGIGANRAPALIAISLLILAYFIKTVFFRRGDAAAAVLLFGMLTAALLQLALPVIGNGEADLAKHMQAFIQLYDTLICLCVIFAIQFFSGVFTGDKLSATRKKQLAALCSAAVCALAAASLITTLPGKRNRSDSYPAPGSVVDFGSYKDVPLRWYVVDNDDGAIWLWCTSEVESMAFGSPSESSQYGSNSWDSSGIRHWLNTDFLTGFSGEQRESILETQRKNYTADSRRDTATGGVHPLYWSHVASRADAYNEDAYSYYSDERVFILGIDEIGGYITRLGLPYRIGRPYWTRSPYAPSDSMVRVVNTQGMILHQDAASVELGVRPSIVVKADYFR